MSNDATHFANGDEGKTGKVGDIAVGYHVPGTNCAQCVLKSLKKYTGISDDLAMALGSGFGSGMEQGEVCGAISGGLMGLGIVAVNAGRKDTKALAREYGDYFKKQYGSMLCRDYKAQHISCNDAIRFGAETAERMIEKILEEQH